jgi:hypothetical protein
MARVHKEWYKIKIGERWWRGLIGGVVENRDRGEMTRSGGSGSEQGRSGEGNSGGKRQPR